jgi:hypothetical protein
MQIVFKNSISSVIGSFSTGQDADIPDDVAAQWIAAGYCDRVESEYTEKEPELEQEPEQEEAPAKRGKRK